MCCNDKMPTGMTQMNGPSGQPVGFEVDPTDFMNPGSGFGPNDVMGAIYARMQMPPDEESGEPPALPDEHGEQEPDPRAFMMQGMR